LAICSYKDGFNYGICHQKIALEIPQKALAKTILLCQKRKEEEKKKADPALVKERGEVLLLEYLFNKYCLRTLYGFRTELIGLIY